MKILFSGDSFTYGDEIVDNETFRFSRLVCNHFSAEEVNLGENAASNDKIVRNVFEYLSLWDVDAVVIQFSVLSRFDAYRSDTKKWDSITPSDIGGAFDHADSFRKSKAKPYYKYIQDDIVDQQRYYQQVLLLQLYLKQKNIPYVMLQLEDPDYSTHKIHEPNYYKDLCEDFECIIPNLIGPHFTDNFCPDRRAEGFPHLHGTHPNYNGHRIIADHIISKL